MKCKVYLTSKKGLLMREEKDFSSLPDAVRKRFEKPTLAKTVTIRPQDKPMARNAIEALKDTVMQGYHIGSYKAISKVVGLTASEP